jgi:hypothetical protein
MHAHDTAADNKPINAAPHPNIRQRTVRAVLSGFLRQPLSRWHWALIPLLAVAAYITVLRIGFLSDDFSQLYVGRATGVNLPSLLPGEQVGFYRPVGVLLIWQVGWFLWGYNPFPFHLVQLLVHASNSLLLGLLLARLTLRPGLGWLAGALFAVFPLHLEAVGFIGAQFDSYSVLFLLGSLVCFTVWWQRTTHAVPGGGPFYAAAFFLYTLAALTKESSFLFIPIFALAAWYSDPPANLSRWRTLALALAPFILPVVLNITLRLSRWGTLGGYGRQADLSQTFWDNAAIYIRLLLAPLNSTVVGTLPVQAVGLLTTVSLLVGLAIFGRAQRRLIILAFAWILLATAPVLALPPRADDLEGNRYLYLISAGYIIAVAAILYSAITSTPRTAPARLFVASLLLLSIIACWLQLRPWHTATVQVNEIVQDLLHLIPSQPRPNGLTWYVENVPARYKGVPVLLSGLGISRLFADPAADYPRIERVQDAARAPITGDAADSFAMRFAYNPYRDRFDIDYLAGVTAGGPPPLPSDIQFAPLVWDFRACERGVLDSWRVVGARPTCTKGEGLVVEHSGDDPQLLGPDLSFNENESRAARFIRLRVAVKYAPASPGKLLVNEWFWRGSNDAWSPARSRALPLKQDGQAHIYWTILSGAQIQPGTASFRFDPANASIAPTVQWIAVDQLP